MVATESEVEEVIAKPWAYPGLVVRVPESLQLSFSRNHSLHVWSAWALFAEGRQFFVRRIEWARGMDRARIVGSAPSTFACEAPMNNSEAERLISSARSLLATRAPTHVGITIDGVLCTVSVAQGSSLARVGWQSGANSSGPWDAWLVEAVSSANAVLPRSTAHQSYGAL
jgi:hypothetical protein